VARRGGNILGEKRDGAQKQYEEVAQGICLPAPRWLTESAGERLHRLNSVHRRGRLLSVGRQKNEARLLMLSGSAPSDNG
jgi:hypothetical protein